MRAPTGKESSSSSLKAEEGDDDFPETLQYKEFLVSRHRRNLSRNRKCLRRRQDFLCHGAVPERPNNKDKPGFTGDLEEEEEQNKQAVPAVNKMVSRASHVQGPSRFPDKP
ncbi:hypothetical protein FQA47_018900 [Oryzias melastigma]|uniref:Uncharacterized protein n=1 Tax=Oryzias melastigma TaxID=30732 RepID=A0A834F8L7_ORYME|nr:hypothetical protein FQA47_018900 [Oryzias melastigma]